MIAKGKNGSNGAVRKFGHARLSGSRDRIFAMNASQLLRRTILLAVLVGVLAGCDSSPPVFRSTDITGASFGQRLSLTDHDGQPRTLADYRGRAVVLFFGYTSCPDICPTALARFAEMMKLLGEDAARVQVLFVTLDPGRDTPAHLKAYVPWFYPTFVGLYGDQAAVDAAAKEFKVYYARQELGSGLGYSLDHSAGAYVFDPAGRIRLYVKDSQTSAEVAADVKLLLAGK